MAHLKIGLYPLCSAVVLLCAGCGYGYGGATATISGTVTGLSAGGSVTLVDNNTDLLTVAANGSFIFATQIQSNSLYDVTVQTQPIGETCSVSGGTGVVNQNANPVTNISVSCISANGNVAGTVVGLTGSNTVTLHDNYSNTSDTLTVVNGAFTFPTTLPSGTVFDVTVATQPTGQTCDVTSGASVMPATGSYDLVSVICK
jgi:hypothetical protein